MQYLKKKKKRQRYQRSNCQHLLNHSKSKRIPEKHLILFHWHFWKKILLVIHSTLLFSLQTLKVALHCLLASFVKKASLPFFFFFYFYLFFLFKFLFLLYFTLQYCIGFGIHWHESATGIHELQNMNPPPTSHPTSSLPIF